MELGMEPYTVALTSCGRFDLLQRTLASLLPRLEGPLEKILIIEDSGNDDVMNVVGQFSDTAVNMEVIVNPVPLGQIESIDLLYSKVETEWIFHCEDDWEFFGDGFIPASFALLKAIDSITFVNPRDPGDHRPGFCLPETFVQPTSVSSVHYRIVDPEVAGGVAGLGFNPGLRRMRDYKITGTYSSFGAIASERHVGELLVDMGFRVAHLAQPAVRHLGGGRHITDPSRFPLRRNEFRGEGFKHTIAKFQFSTAKRMDRIRWKLNPDTDPFASARRRFKAALSDMNNWVYW